MNRKTLLIVLSVLLVAALVPWEKIKLKDKREPDCQSLIDSLENEMNAAKMNYMRAGQRIGELNDSLYTLGRVIDKNNKNYIQLKKQNEILQKERAALINGFSDDDIERYLSNRYDQ